MCRATKGNIWKRKVNRISRYQNRNSQQADLLEVKTFAKKNYGTTQRSFYFSPTDDPKVTEDAYHLAVGFEMVRQGNKFTPVGFEISDLYGLLCDLKSEFNSDNRRMVDDSRILVKERVV